MRTYGRTVDVLSGAKTWWLVSTNYCQSAPLKSTSNNPNNGKVLTVGLPPGFNDSVYTTALAQICKLNLNESPFFADWGIPAHESVMTQIYPDLFIARIQSRMSGYFASLIMTSTPIQQGSSDSFANNQSGAPAPYYTFSIITNYGARVGVTTRPDYPQEQPI